MPDDDHRRFYPDIQASGSLRSSLQDALVSVGSGLAATASEQWFPLAYARVELAARFVQVYVAAKERLFLSEFWAHGVAFASGQSPDLPETAAAIHAWVSSDRLLTSDMAQRYSWFVPRPEATSYETGTEVDAAWARLLADTSRSEDTRRAIEAASREPRLRQLFPYTSMFTLCFSRCTGYPFTRDIPCITPLGRGRYSVAEIDGSDIVGGDIDACVAAVLRHLPPDCGPARRGVASDL